MSTRNMLQEATSNEDSSNPPPTKQRQYVNIAPIKMTSGEVVETYNIQNSHKHVQKKQKVVFTTPNNFDVLSGRGNGVAHHPGNQIFRNIVKEHQGMYSNLAANNSKKRAFVMNIMEKVKTNGGRFLKLNHSDASGKFWVCMTFDESRKKTAQALRDGVNMYLKEQPLTSNKEQLTQITTNTFSPSNNPSIVRNDRPGDMNLQDRINGEMVNCFKKEINRIRGDMNELKRKYDQLNREQDKLTKDFMNQIAAGGSCPNEISD